MREVIVGGRVIGRKKEHIFFTNRKPGGRGEGHTYYDLETGQACYCISCDALEILRDKGVTLIQIIEWHKDVDARRRVLCVTIEEFLDAPVIRHEPFEAQHAYPIDRMKVIRHYPYPRELIPVMPPQGQLAQEVAA